METIRRANYEHADRADVQEAVAQAVERDPTSFLDQYRRHPESFAGRYVGADLFKEMFVDYRQSNEARNRYNAPTHNSAAALASALFNDVVNDRTDPTRDKAVFLTGSPGAGKTTTVLSQNGMIGEDVSVVYEGQMFRPELSFPKIQAALDAGLKPEIIAVQPLPERALENTFRRFDQVGRGANIQTMALIQGELAGGLREIHLQFGQAVSVIIFDYRNPENRRGHEGWEHLQVLESEGSRDAIQERLTRHLQRHRDAGTITDACFRQAAGLAPTRTTLHARGLEAQGAPGHEQSGSEPRPGLSPEQARILIRSVASRPDLRSEELARAHFMARQDKAWATDYDARHGESVARRSQELASQHGKALATTLQTAESAKGSRQYPELKPHYEALQAAASAMRAMPPASHDKALSALRTKLAGQLAQGVSSQRSAPAVTHDLSR